MKILVIGGGGREHALAWKLGRAEKVTRVFVAPGNAGTAFEPKTENVDVGAEDIDALIAFAKRQHVELTVVGPEALLVAGIVDRFSQEGLPIFGPTAAVAQLEGSKSFAKQFMRQHGIPTGEYAVFTDIDRAKAYILSRPVPIVIKADGLAAGKGVTIAQTHAEATHCAEKMLSGASFGEAGRQIVIEEFIQGEEASFICMVDGRCALPMASSQDHKARDEGDNGPNTGGMGAYSPAPAVTGAMHRQILEEIIYPVVNGFAEQGTPYVGFLYAGLIIDAQGNPYVLEFNCRLGDPEAQPILMRMQSDLAELCRVALAERLHRHEIQWDSRAALGVVLAAQGYPEQYEKGRVIEGLPRQEKAACKVFHAGTRLQNGRTLTNGGRVLCVTALGDDIGAAQKNAYRQVREISWPGMFCRSDIGYRAIGRE